MNGVDLKTVAIIALSLAAAVVVTMAVTLGWDWYFSRKKDKNETDNEKINRAIRRHEDNVQRRNEEDNQK